MKRRSAGEGSIYYRKADCLWCASISIGPRADRKRKTVCRKHRADLVKILATMQIDPIAATTPAPAGVTLDHSAEGWLTNVVAVNTKPKTADGYRSTYETHIKPHLGKLEIAKLQPRHVQVFMAELARADVGGRARQYVLFVLKSILSNAKKLGQVTTNVAADIDVPSHEKKQIAWHGADEASRVVSTARKEEPHYAAFYALAYDSGARWGELAGLQWQDLELGKSMWRVRHNLIERKGRTVLTESPKTTAGRRAIELSAECIAALRAHRAAMAKAGRNVVEGFVFLTEKGNELRLSNFTQRVHTPLLKKAKVKRVSPHGLRHTLATLLIAAGVPIKVVSERLGHEDVSTTMRIYQHVLREQQTEAAVRIGRILKTGSL